MLRKIKSLIPNSIKAEILAFIQPVNLEEYGRYKGKKKFFVFLCGYYQNLGDMALTYAHKLFLRENFPRHEVIMVPSTKTYKLMKTMKYVSGRDDIVTILGGGNMDDTYTSLEEARQFVIRNFLRNKIVSFPQTMAFSGTPYGRKRLKKTTRVYNMHRDLHVFTRERASLEMMKKHFKKAKTGFCPDMVLYLNRVHPQRKRSGVLCCLRNDREKRLSESQVLDIRRSLESISHDIVFTDTINVSLEECRPENMEKTLYRFWDLLKSKKVVVTDRLHCMIFCAITKTPCVVLDNSNRKISGVYNEWLKNLGYIVLLKEFSIEEMKKGLDFAFGIKTADYSYPGFKNRFQSLAEACRPGHSTVNKARGNS